MFQPTDSHWLELQISATILAALSGGYVLGIQWLYRYSETIVVRLILSFTIVAVSLIAAIPTGLEFPKWVFVFFGIVVNGVLFAFAQRFISKSIMIGGRELIWGFAGVSTAMQCLFFAALLSTVVDMHWWKVIITLILAAVALKASEISIKRFVTARDKLHWWIWHLAMSVIMANAIIMTVFFT